MPARKKTTAAKGSTARKKATTSRSGKATTAAKKKTTRTTKKKTTRRSKPPEATDQPEVVEALQLLQETTAALTAQVQGLREALPAPSEGGEGPRAGGPSPATEAQPEAGLPALASTLSQISIRLAESLAEVPKGEDFEPLAEHLYEFARTAPGLQGALQEIPKTVQPIEAAVKALQETSETLQFTHESFAESLLRLPRAEDYEPLAKPLQEFAKVSPLLAESLKEVLAAVTPLADSVRELRGIGERLESTRTGLKQAVEAVSAPAVSRSSPPASARQALGEVLREMDTARDAILEALGTLPREPEYSRFATNLRELATASPSLMEWLEQVPSLEAPLEGSVVRLHDAAARLHGGRSRLVEILEEWGEGRAGEDG